MLFVEIIKKSAKVNGDRRKRERKREIRKSKITTQEIRKKKLLSFWPFSNIFFILLYSSLTFFFNRFDKVSSDMKFIWILFVSLFFLLSEMADKRTYKYLTFLHF
jgi:hypothetical protein